MEYRDHGRPHPCIPEHFLILPWIYSVLPIVFVDSFVHAWEYISPITADHSNLVKSTKSWRIRANPIRNWLMHESVRACMGMSVKYRYAHQIASSKKSQSRIEAVISERCSFHHKKCIKSAYFTKKYPFDHYFNVEPGHSPLYLINPILKVLFPGKL